MFIVLKICPKVQMGNRWIKWKIDLVMKKNHKLWPTLVILVLGRPRQVELGVGLQSETPCLKI